MKHLYQLGLGLLIALCASCDDFLDTVPKGKVIPTTVSDYGNIMKDISLSGSYDALPYFCSDDVFVPDEQINLGGPSHKAYFWMEHFYRQDEADKNWNDTYSKIYTVNVVINNIMGATEGSQEDKERIMAEAKIFRAYYYWYLQQLYAAAYDAETAATDLSVPMPLEPNLEAKLSRVTVEQVSAQILSDLEGIAEQLPVMGSNPYKPNRAAAYAMRARALFFMREYDKAAAEADQALKLNSQLDDMREWSFTDDIPSVTVNGMPQPISSAEKIWYHNVNGSGALRMTVVPEDLLALYKQNEKDLRLKFWFSTEDKNGFFYDENTYCYLQQTPNHNIGVPEMMLIKAEALARKNDAKALDILNELRKYRFQDADYTELTPQDGKNLLEIVLAERRRELALSGLRWFDMKRLIKDGLYTQTLTRVTPDGETHTLSPTSNRYLFPIPLEVIAKNGNIVQNPR